MEKLPSDSPPSLVAAFENRAFSIAKAAAYSALLSFFPVLTSAAAILVQTKADFVSTTIAEFLFEVVPPGAEELVRYQFAVRGKRPVALLIVAAALAIWAASGMVGSLIQGFQSAYRIVRAGPSSGTSRSRCCWWCCRASLCSPACALILFGGYIDRFVMRFLSIDPILSPVAHLLALDHRAQAGYAVAFAALVAVTMLLYYYGPFRRQRWAGVWRGAMLATALWFLATDGFGWYVRHLANYNVLYGSVATSIALLVWMYLMSLIALLGCEFNAEYERQTAATRSSL